MHAPDFARIVHAAEAFADLKSWCRAGSESVAANAIQHNREGIVGAGGGPGHHTGQRLELVSSNCRCVMCRGVEGVGVDSESAIKRTGCSCCPGRA